MLELYLEHQVIEVRFISAPECSDLEYLPLLSDVLYIITPKTHFQTPSWSIPHVLLVPFISISLPNLLLIDHKSFILYEYIMSALCTIKWFNFFT